MPNVCQEALPYARVDADIQAVPKSQHVLHRHDLAQKLAQAMRLRKRTQAQVAAEFGVSRPTVSSDWLKEGRIAKKHLPHLVEYFELPYEWWLTNAVGAPDVFAYRRENLVAIVSADYSSALDKAGKSLGFESESALIDHMNGVLAISTDLARRIEIAAKRPKGSLDAPPTRPHSIDQRFAALPEPLQTYLLGELELCERVAEHAGAKFLRAPQGGDEAAFREHLLSLLDDGHRRKVG